MIDDSMVASRRSMRAALPIAAFVGFDMVRVGGLYGPMIARRVVFRRFLRERHLRISSPIKTAFAQFSEWTLCGTCLKSLPLKKHIK